MPGKLCTGAVLNNAFRTKESKAFSEGIYYRAAGTEVTNPKLANPHAAGSSAADAWDRGWDVAEAASPGVISQSSAPCVAVPDNAIAAAPP